MKTPTTYYRAPLISSAWLQVMLILLLGFGIRTYGQAVTGTLLGTITDQTGGVVAGANITITEINTNQSRSTSTNESGNYVLGHLDRGTYRLEVQIAGFKKAIRERVDVLINNDTRVDIQLEPGGVSESAEIVASVPLLQTDRADVGSQIETRQLQDMPLA